MQPVGIFLLTIISTGQTESPTPTKDVLDLIVRSMKAGISPAERLSICKLAVDKAFQTKDMGGQALSMLLEGKALQDSGRNNEALECYNRAVLVQDSIKDWRDEGLTLNNIGLLHYNLGQYADALVSYNKALIVEKKANDSRALGTTLFNIGLVYSFTKPASALDYFRRARATHKSIKLYSNELDDLEALGGTQENLGLMQDAIDTLGQAIVVAKSASMKQAEAKFLDHIGAIYSDIGQAQSALDCFDKALAIQADSKVDLHGQATTLNHLGRLYSYRGQKNLALQYYVKAQTLRKQSGDLLGEAQSNDNIAAIQLALGQPQLAIKSCEDGLTIVRGIQRNDIVAEESARDEEGRLLDNLAQTYFYLGQVARSLDTFKAALAIRSHLVDKIGEATTLNNIGTVYLAQNDPQTALSYFQRSTTTAHALGDLKAEATALNNAGSSYSYLGQNDSALKTFTKALEINRQVFDPKGEATTLNGLGEYYRNLAQPDKALPFYEQSLVALAEAGDAGGEAVVLSNIALVEKTKSPAFACLLVSLALRNGESLGERVHGLDAGVRRSFSESYRSDYWFYADMLAQAGRTAEFQQALALPGVDFASRTLKPITWTMQEEKWVRGFEKRLELSAKAGISFSMQSARRITNPSQNSAIAAALHDRDVARKAFFRFMEESAAESSKWKVPKGSDSKTQASVQMEEALSALPVGTCAVYAALGIDTLRLLVVKRGHKFLVSLPAKALAKDVLNYNKLLQDPSKDPRPLGQVIYKMIVQPIERELSGTGTTMWYFSDLLNGIPIDTLWDGKQFLLEKYPSCMFSPSILERLAVKSHGSNPPIIFGTTGSHVVVEPVTAESISFPSLPGVESEANNIGNELGIAPALDNQFTAHSMLEGFAKRPSMIHLATHFRYVPGDDRRSFLLLGDGSPYTVDTLKSLPENMLRGVDLVSLSACATSSDEGAMGLKVESLAAWFQRKGAGAVIATLWPVADESSSRLMADFYRLRNSGRATKLQALREAKLRMLRGETSPTGSGSRRSTEVTLPPSSVSGPLWPKNFPRFAHPYFWAPFYLTGNWL